MVKKLIIIFCCTLIYCSNYKGIYKLDLSGNIITSYGVERPRSTRITFGNNTLFFRRFGKGSIWQIDLDTSIVSTFFKGWGGDQ